MSFDKILELHRFLSLFTLIVLVFAGLLALVLASQDVLLRHKPQLTWLNRFPPLESLEKGLFVVNKLGFLLLTFILISSFYFFYDLMWEQTALLEKTIVTVSAWFIFLILLLGRRWRGWRGRKAIHATWLGISLLIVVYVGSLLI